MIKLNHIKLGPLAKSKHITCTHQDFTSTDNINQYLNHICGLGMLSPWPWDDVTVQLNDAYWRTSTSFHLLSTNTSRTQCATMSHLFLPTKACCGRAMHMVGFLKAYQSLLAEIAWIMPKCKPNSADFLFRELEIISKIPKLPPSYGDPTMALNASVLWSPAHQRCLDTWVTNSVASVGQKKRRKIWENRQKMIGNLRQIPFLHESLLNPNNFASCVWTTVLSDPPLGETWARTCKISSIRMAWEDLL